MPAEAECRVPANRIHRREPRYVICTPVTVLRFLPRGPVATPGLSLEMSRSGMSILVCGAPQVGETVLVSQRSATKPVEMVGSVRHTAEGRCGVEFSCLQDWVDEQCGTQERWVRAFETSAETLRL